MTGERVLCFFLRSNAGSSACCKTSRQAAPTQKLIDKPTDRIMERLDEIARAIIFASGAMMSNGFHGR